MLPSAQVRTRVAPQYFMGGSGEWENKSYHDICDQLIPLEIALRVSRAIMADEPFACYVIIPMWPEGAPRPHGPRNHPLHILSVVSMRKNTPEPRSGYVVAVCSHFVA